MKPTTWRVPAFERAYGWANRVLWIDLSVMHVRAEPSAPYLPDYMGARGIGCPDRLGRVSGAGQSLFDPANPLMVFPGALTGSRAPYSGRTNVCAFSPQASPLSLVHALQHRRALWWRAQARGL